MNPNDKSILIIGAGPGGYTAAFRAADLGFKVTLIDEFPTPGGVCLYQGCIPSKTLLHVAKVISETKEISKWGINFSQPQIDIAKLRDHKENVISKLTSGLIFLAKQRKIKFIQGKASFQNSKTILIEKSDGTKENLNFEKAIIATGSRPTPLKSLPSSSKIIYSSGALQLDNIPSSLLVVGGGYIGLELGSVYASLGTKVSVVEMTPTLLPQVDRDLTQILTRRLKTLFPSISLETKVISAKETEQGIEVQMEDKNHTIKEEIFDKVFVAIGRKPNGMDLGLEKTKVKLNEKGFIEVNSSFQTEEPSIYAIGDVIGEPMLAHKASDEGRKIAEILSGQTPRMNAKIIPAVVFTDPEIAWCGLTESVATQQNREIKIVKFPWTASGRALTLNRLDGLTKLIIDPKTEKILGAGIAGVHAGELISELTLAIEHGLTVKDLKSTVHPHPTLSETLMEAAEVFYKESLHIYTP